MGELDVEGIPEWVDMPAVPGPQGREGYGHIDFEGLPNTRDLGGLVGADGRRVRRGQLLRSGMLGTGSQADIARLRDEYRLRAVADFRNDLEVEETPDPMEDLPGARWLHVSILDEDAAGVAQDRESQERMWAQLEANPALMREILAKFYPNILLGDAGIAGYGAFFRMLVEGADEPGAVLWHCSLGRDRCGIGSLLVETALGVSWDDAEADYLATNLFQPREFLQMGSGASLASIRAVRDAAEREFGGLLGYLHEALGVTDPELAALRARYLEP